MKKIIRKNLSILNKLYFILFNRQIPAKGNKFYLTRCFVQVNNRIELFRSDLISTIIKIDGNNNLLIAKRSLIQNCRINISGKNNKLILQDNVKLRGAIIHLRGNDCSIVIGSGTSTGGVRIVNVGNKNDITIGENCLFSDYIEIWASDTHSILNEKKEKINIEKPIKIGNNVWVGSRVTILKGVKIGNWAIIGMGSMVVRDIPQKSISVGTPNRIIKEGVTWKLEY